MHLVSPPLWPFWCATAHAEGCIFGPCRPGPRCAGGGVVAKGAGARRAQGEVLAGLQQKLKYSERERMFCCLVAEGAEQPGALAGVVEVSLQGEPVRAPCSAPAREGALPQSGVAALGRRA